MKINFGTETRDKLDSIGKTRTDITWIGNSEFTIDIENFFYAADKYVYDDGYGRPEVPADIKIVFTDGSWLERAEYDGSEWWEYKVINKRPLKHYSNQLDFRKADETKRDYEHDRDSWAPQLKYALK